MQAKTLTTTHVHSLLFSQNLTGSGLTQEQVERINIFLVSPNCETWDDIARMVIHVDERGNTTTIWHGLLENFPYYPNTGRCYDRNGKVIADWPTVPTPYAVRASINKTIFTHHYN
jgi:hypothetical protein